MSESKATEVFARRLHQAIKDKELSQSKLASRVGLTKAAVNKWIKGKGLPSADTLDKLAEALGHPVGWFFVDEAQQGQRQVDLKAEVQKLREATKALEELTEP